MTRLEIRDVSLAYGDTPVVSDVSVTIPDGDMTAIVGPNGCGKSTLLRGVARLMSPSQGSVVLDGRDIHRMHTREVARSIGLLPQSPIAPDGITVRELAARGRTPYQSVLRPRHPDDVHAVDQALAATGMTEFADRVVDRLSGGQRQRAWIAMALAQDTPILLLDEPTTYLDIHHQYDVLDLLYRLNKRDNRTIVMVVHDLNQAARYADHVVVMKKGRVAAEGTPAEVITGETVTSVFSVPTRIVPDPVTGTPLLVPANKPGATCAPVSLVPERHDQPSDVSPPSPAPMTEEES